jgi:TonB family protein
LRKETYFRANRIFLLFSVIFSLLLPLLNIPVYAPQTNLIAEVRITPYQNLLETVIVGSQGLSETVETAVVSSSIIIWLYLVGTVIFLLLFLFRSVQIWQLIKSSEVKTLDGYKLVVVNSSISPFSFLKYIFISRNFKDKEGHQRMLQHEMEHVKQGHTFDVLILEILIIFQWFNPFIWILRRAIRENHEYLADKAVLLRGVRPEEYKQLLLSQFIGGPLMATSHFNYSLVKNRIYMMTKIESSKLAFARFLPGLLLATGLVIMFACEPKNNSVWYFVNDTAPSVISEAETKNTISAVFNGDTLSFTGSDADLSKVEEFISSARLSSVREEGGNLMYVVKATNEQIAETLTHPEVSNTSGQVFFIVEKMPEFPGGEAALRNFIASNVQYPQSAQANGIQGRVYVQFIVTSNGSVADATIARGVDPLLDREALRVVRSLPRWKPGQQRGMAVNVSYTIPINFSLQ